MLTKLQLKHSLNFSNKWSIPTQINQGDLTLVKEVAAEDTKAPSTTTLEEKATETMVEAAATEGVREVVAVETEREVEGEVAVATKIEVATEASIKHKVKVAGTSTKIEAIEIEIAEMREIDMAEAVEVAEAIKETEVVMAIVVVAVVLATNQANHSLLCQSTQRKPESRNRVSLPISSE